MILLITRGVFETNCHSQLAKIERDKRHLVEALDKGILFQN